MTGNVGSTPGLQVQQTPYGEAEATDTSKADLAPSQIGATTPASHKDDISQASGSRLEYLTYSQDVKEPKLPTPNSNASTLIDQDLLAAAKEFGIDLKKEIKFPQNDASDLAEQINKWLDSEDVKEALANSNPEFTETRVRAGIFLDQNSDPKFASLSAKAREQLSSKKGGKAWQEEASQTQKELGQISDGLFVKYAKQKAPKEEQKALEFAYKTRGDGAVIEEKLSTTQLKLYKEILADVEAEFVQELGFSTPAPSLSQAKMFIATLEIDYDNKVIGSLQTAFIEGTITKEELQSLKAFHFLGEAKAQEQIKPLYENLTYSVKEEFFVANGLPKNVELNPKSLSFQAEISHELRNAFDVILKNSEFSDQQLQEIGLARENYPSASKEAQALFDELLQTATNLVKADLNLPENWKPLISEYNQALLTNIEALSVSPEKKEAILKALEAPSLLPVAPDVEELLSSVIAKTIEQMRETEGVSKLWMPVSVDLPTFPEQATALVINAIDILKESQMSTMTAMEALPKEDVQVAVYMNYLKAISEALNELQMTLYEVQMASVRRSRQLSTAQQDMMANSIANQEKIAKQQKKMEKAQNKQGKKGKDMNLAIKIIAPIAMAAMIAAIVLTGGLAAPFLIPALMICGFMLANSISTSAGGPDLMEGMMQGVGKLVAMAGGGKDAQLAVQGAVIAVILAAFILCAITTGNPMLLMVGISFATEMMMADNFLYNSCKECGASDKEALIATLCILAVFMIAGMVGGGMLASKNVATGAKTAQTGTQAAQAGQTAQGAQTGAQAGQTADATQDAAEVAETAERAKRISDMAEQSRKFSAVVNSGTTMTQGGVQMREGLAEYRLATIKSELEKVLGKKKARQEEIEAMLSILQQVLHTLIDSLGNTSEQISSISQLQEKKYRDASSKWVINQGA